jgi:hypothetical protein
VSRRASLPGADELFRRTSSERSRDVREESAESQQVTKSPKLQVASGAATADLPADPARATPKKTPKHDEKVTFYCTGGDLMALETARLRLRADYGVAADRGRIVRAALSYVLEDFEARAEDSVLLRRLTE